MVRGRPRVSRPAFASRYDTPGWRRAEARQREWGESGSRGPRPPGSIFEGAVHRQGSPASVFHAGSRVFHNKFGPGAVVAVDGSKLTVDFDKAGRKLVMDSFVAAGEHSRGGRPRRVRQPWFSDSLPRYRRR